jgi:hypothetical protein
MDKRYASKIAPESTIVRIEALEAATKALQERPEGSGQDHTQTLEKHWTEIEKLMNQMNASTSAANGDIDTATIMRKIHSLETSLIDKADKAEIVKARAHTDEKIAEAMAETEKTVASIRNEVGNFREEYFLFVSKDHTNLEGRVTILEKKISAMSKKIEGMPMPEYSASNGNVDEGVIIQINNRLGDLEANYEDLRDQFAKWIKQV